MAQVIVQVNGKTYGVGCEDGQESHVRALATLIDDKVKDIASDAAALGETRLILLGGLMLADDVNQLRAALAAEKVRTARLEADALSAETRAVLALETAAQKLETMAAR